MAGLAILIGACTISSESPDASSLSGRSGPSSGTTTTSGAGDGAATPDGSGEQEPEAGDESAAGDTGESPDGTAPTTTDRAGTAPDAAVTADPAAGPEPEEVAGERTGTAGEPAGAATSPTQETASGPADTAAEGDDGVPTTDTAPAPDSAPAPDTDGTTTLAESAFDERSKVSTVGIGSVYFGMSPEESAERVGTVWEGVPAGGADCYVITPANGPPGVALWVYHGTVERVDIDTPLLRTQSGLGVGTHLGELQSRLGEKLTVEDHPYLAGWTLATFVPTDPNDAAFRIAFDISGGEVIRFRAGRTEIVALESCA